MNKPKSTIIVDGKKKKNPEYSNWYYHNVYKKKQLVIMKKRHEKKLGLQHTNPMMYRAYMRDYRRRMKEKKTMSLTLKENLHMEGNVE